MEGETPDRERVALQHRPKAMLGKAEAVLLQTTARAANSCPSTKTSRELEAEELVEANTSQRITGLFRAQPLDRATAPRPPSQRTTWRRISRVRLPQTLAPELDHTGPSVRHIAKRLHAPGACPCCSPQSRA